MKYYRKILQSLGAQRMRDENVGSFWKLAGAMASNPYRSLISYMVNLRHDGILW